MKIHINYAHGAYLDSQKKCCETALSHGFDITHPLGIGDIGKDFIEKNAYAFLHSRGAGFWVWKPYIILQTLEKMSSDDWLMYTDSGMYFVRNPWDWILSEKDKIGEKGIATFGFCGTNRQFTKRDTFVLMDADNPTYTDGYQRMASVFVCRKTDFSMNFVKEWLEFATNPCILTDLPNRMRKPNYPEFKGHRHDQSIMSILGIRHDTFVFEEDITQFSNNNPYLIHHRNRN